ncbi:hypothetical protein OS493_029167 [Desmophyllum pertusum]|uniref:Uncharacterized protein n=1 Tax=Desmophyllum pertusum TaxID=174260 RepID=A0A9W9ZXW1_9CNID|nr:hypothetical protein OS493_029167 [Desmophyllum pertusum]
MAELIRLCEMADDSMVLEDDSQPLGVTASTSYRKAVPTLVTQDGVIGYRKEGESFQPRTNFTVEVVGCLKMEGYIVGYLFSIKRNDDDTARQAFLCNTDCASSCTILKVLNKAFNNRGLWVPTKGPSPGHRLALASPEVNM